MTAPFEGHGGCQTEPEETEALWPAGSVSGTARGAVGARSSSCGAGAHPERAQLARAVRPRKEGGAHVCARATTEEGDGRVQGGKGRVEEGVGRCDGELGPWEGLPGRNADAALDFCCQN